MRASAATGAPAFDTPRPSTVTWPARIRARARSRDGASPRSTSATSRRFFAGTRLILAGDDPVDDGREMAVDEPGPGQRAPRARRAVGGHLPRSIEAEERGIGRLRAGGVLARRLAELRGAAFHVEDVVDDLKTEAEIVRVLMDGGEERLIGAGHDGAADRRGANERAGLLRMHRAEA